MVSAMSPKGTDEAVEAGIAQGSHRVGDADDMPGPRPVETSAALLDLNPINGDPGPDNEAVFKNVQALPSMALRPENVNR